MCGSWATDWRFECNFCNSCSNADNSIIFGCWGTPVSVGCKGLATSIDGLDREEVLTGTGLFNCSGGNCWTPSFTSAGTNDGWEIPSFGDDGP